MSRAIKVLFSVGMMSIAGSTQEEEVEITVDDDADDAQIQQAIEDEYDLWLGQYVDTFWDIIE